jgi:hypothetical protein
MCMSSHPSLILQNACALHIGVGYTGVVVEATEGVSGGPLFILTCHNSEEPLVWSCYLKDVTVTSIWEEKYL